MVDTRSLNSNERKKINKYMHYILYKTTNLLNEKYYIGVHETKDLNDGYLGSGVALFNAVRKYGKENFSREILETFNNSIDMYNREKVILTSEIINDPLCYNIAYGGTGGSMKQNQKPFNGPHTEETKLLISEKAKARIGEKNGMYGKTHSDETKKLLAKITRERFLGKSKTDKHKKKIAESLMQKYKVIDASENVKIINNLKKWCKDNDIDCTKVYAFVGKGPIKMIERYRSPTREFFENCSIEKI